MVRKYLIFLTFLCIYGVQAQDRPYNQWSIDAMLGVHHPSSPFADGYQTSGLQFPDAAVGMRYMWNSRVGTMASVGYLAMTEGEGSTPFKSTSVRGSLELVLNIGNLFRQLTWNSQFTLLAHAGGGLSHVKFDTAEAGGQDNPVHLVFGLTPEYKLTDRIALIGDISLNHYMNMENTWDGTESFGTGPGSGAGGNILRFGLGVSISLGKKGTRAEFYPFDSNTRPCL